MKSPNTMDNRDVIVRDLRAALTYGTWQMERLGEAFLLRPQPSAGNGLCRIQYGSEVGGVVVNRTLRAVYEEDLDQYLAALGIAEQLSAGGVSCGVCGEVVTRDTLAALFPHNGEIAACCEKAECLSALPREVIP